VLTEAQVGGTAVPEAVQVEGVVPKAEVLAEVALEPVVTVAPEAIEEVRDDAVPESSMDVVVWRLRYKTRSRSGRRQCRRPQWPVVMDSSFWRMISSTRRR
jgi:hypothetical protein